MDLSLLTRLVAERTGLAERAVEQTLCLLQDGATIPFISRYRKEQTGGLNEVEIARISLEGDRLTELERRKQTILTTIESQDKLTDELRAKIDATWDATALEDLYLPYRPRRRTRAQVAREAGLEPLADKIWRREPCDFVREALRYLNPEAKITTADEAIAGARDIVAERVSEDQRARQTVRALFRREAYIVSRLAKKELAAEGQKFRDYFAWSEPLKRCSSHRLLAMRRGEEEGILRLSLTIDDDEATSRLHRQYHSTGLLSEAIDDGYTRLLCPSIETEFFRQAKDKADEEAIRIFARNLEQLLMASPLGQKRVMAIDPGFRTGCKVVCLSAEGDLLYFEAIYPHPPRRERVAATRTLARLVETYHIEAIAIGNGTAGRETQEFVEHIDLPDGVDVYMVSEDGASIYSASDLAREEFPDKDVTVRGAVSIGRRLMDPMAELVKIDPSSIGVGQYQKDVNQAALGRQLGETVVSCVNRVGVNLNTASPYLLTYISGLGPALARGIVRFRQEHGPFRSRRELMAVPRLGAKAFEQAAGFLRVEGDEPLDNSAVHPERYPLVARMASDLGATVPQLMADKSLRQRIDPERYVSPEVGLPTLHDILAELDRPSRDPRQPIHTFAFDPTVHEIDDLREGMLLPGIITNITAFGAFVDVGVHVKGLVHVSQLADRYVRDPNEVVSLHQEVRVKVVSVDLERQRIALTMKGLDA